MKHQFHGFRIFLLGLAMLAAVVPAPVNGRSVQPASQQTGSPTCDWPSWTCTGVNYGSTPPSSAPKITYITDYQSVLSCVNDITVTQELPGSGHVKLNCPGWPQPMTIRECPINEVIREPYPRALVTVPITFTLKNENILPKLDSTTAGPPAKNSTMAKTSYGVMLVHGAAGLVTLSVRGTRLDANTTWFGQKVISPTWTFQDRTWNVTPAYQPIQRTLTATYQYQASSYGLPEKGRGYNIATKLPAGNYDLPAYPVQLATPCKYEFQVVVQKHWPFWTFDAPPILDPVTKQRTNNAGKWNTQWVNVTTAWAGINMKSYGYPNTYEWWDVVRSGGKFKNVEYWDQPDPSKIWIPVLEVQSVLRSESCNETGGTNCPKAEPESITPPAGGAGGLGATGTGSLTGGGGGGSIINPPQP